MKQMGTGTFVSLATAFVAICALLAAPGRASAQADGGSDFEGRTPVSMRNGMPWDPDLSYPGSGYLGVDVGFSYRDLGPGSSQRSFAPVVEGWYAPSETFGVSLWIPFLQSTVETPDTLDGVIRIGNVTLGAHAATGGERVTLMAGLELATPTARVGNTELPEGEDNIRAAFALASMMGGHARRWLWWPGRMSAVVPLRVGYRPLPPLTLALDATGAVGFAVGDEENDPVEVAGVLTPQATWGAGDVTAGLRAPVSVSTIRRYQVAVEPFVRWMVDTIYLAAAFTLSLAGDGGFGFADDGVWAVHVGGGAVFGEDTREPRDTGEPAGTDSD